MKTVHVLATVFLVAAICVESGYGIKCFVCNSNYQQNCRDDFDKTTHPLTECGSEYDRCRKIVHERTYIRQCAKTGIVGKDDRRDCKDKFGTNSIKIKYCYCDSSDGCNSATSWNLPLTLLAGALAGQYFWHKL